MIYLFVYLLVIYLFNSLFFINLYIYFFIFLDACHTSPSEDLWHGVPITTDHTVFQNNNKAKYKRKRHENNREETTTNYPSHKRQNNSTHEEYPRRSQSRNASCNGFLFSAGKVDKNVDATMQSTWGKFQGKTATKHSKYPATCTNTGVQDDNFLFTGRQMDEDGSESSSRWVNFQADRLQIDCSTKSTINFNVSVTSKQINKQSSASSSKSTTGHKNDILQNENISGTSKQMTGKGMGGIGSKWDKFQTAQTLISSHDSDENEKDGLAFSTNEKRITGKENAKKIGSKWDKYQTYHTPSDDDDDSWPQQNLICNSNAKDRSGDDDCDGDNDDNNDNDDDDNNNNDGDCNNKQGVMLSTNVFQIDDELEGEWWNI